MNIKSILFSTILILSMVACKDNAASRIDDKNLESAKLRDSQTAQGMAVIRFDKTEHDFGTIKEGDVVETTFEIENIGTADLIISNASATCGCTVPEWPKEPIKPKGKGVLKVHFDSNGKPNKQHKTITLSTNTENGSEMVSINLFVTPKTK